MTNNDVTIMLDILKKLNSRLSSLFLDRGCSPQLHLEFYYDNSHFKINFLGIIIFDTFHDEFDGDWDGLETDLINEINELLTNLSGKILK
jgi:hypothetical protein